MGEYQDSPEWATLRKQALLRADHRCQVCNNSEGLHVHHRVYPKVMGQEHIGDLTVLCGECHFLFHRSQWSGITPDRGNRKRPGESRHDKAKKAKAESAGKAAAEIKKIKTKHEAKRRADREAKKKRRPAPRNSKERCEEAMRLEDEMRRGIW